MPEGKRPSGIDREQIAEQNRQAIIEVIKAAGGTIFLSDLERKVADKVINPVRVVGKMVQFDWLKKTEGNGEVILTLSAKALGSKEEPPTEIISNQQALAYNNMSGKLSLFVAKVIPVSEVNAASTVKACLEITPLKVESCRGYKLSFADKELSVPFTKGMSFWVTSQVPDVELPENTKAIQKAVTVTLLPVAGSVLIVNGKHYHNINPPFSFDVPEDHWILFMPNDTGEVIILGEKFIFDVYAAYVSLDDRFAEASSMPLPMTSDRNFIIGGNGMKLDWPFIGFVVPTNKLPQELRSQCEPLMPRERQSEQAYGAIVGFQVPQGTWITL